MQPGVINLLLTSASAAAPAKEPAATAAASNNSPAEGSSFAKLLTKAEDKPSDKQHTPPDTGSKKDSGSPAAGNQTLAAQEVANDQAPSADLSQAEITPENAAELLDRLEQLSGRFTDQPADQEALLALKQQLQMIRDSGIPKRVGEVVAASPQLKQQLEAMQDTAPLPPASLLRQVMAMLQTTLGKSIAAEEAPTPDDAAVSAADDSVVDAALQSLQASLFHSHAATYSAVEDAAQRDSEPKKTDDAIDETLTEIIPLSAQLMTLPAWATKTEQAPVPQITAPAIHEIQSAAPAPAPAIRPDLDTVIPPLTAKESVALPEVNLPGMTVGGALKEPAPSESSLSAAAAAGGDKAAMDKLDALLNPPTSDAAKNAVLNPSMMNGHSPTQTTHAVQPAAMVAIQNIVNHAPVADQVHVAIKQASGEGVDRIFIQLDPPDLGRVEVHMRVASDGQTQISFTADKASTFDSLSRDARMLERSLQDAGIKADAGSMQFNLRQQPQPQLQSDLGQGQGGQNRYGNDDSASEPELASAITGPASLTRYYNINIHDGVDIRA